MKQTTLFILLLLLISCSTPEPTAVPTAEPIAAATDEPTAEPLDEPLVERGDALRLGGGIANPFKRLRVASTTSHVS